MRSAGSQIPLSYKISTTCLDPEDVSGRVEEEAVEPSIFLDRYIKSFLFDILASHGDTGKLTRLLISIVGDVSGDQMQARLMRFSQLSQARCQCAR